ncbi:MAG: hypothetical protein IJH81_08115 [Lachnospiraceae bacterium]|nr:hypothetical protein [Lachnospiraceae bacterium]
MQSHYRSLKAGAFLNDTFVFALSRCGVFIIVDSDQENLTVVFLEDSGVLFVPDLIDGCFG